jgi:hypothetical protein
MQHGQGPLLQVGALPPRLAQLPLHAPAPGPLKASVRLRRAAFTMVRPGGNLKGLVANQVVRAYAERLLGTASCCSRCKQA